MKYIFQLPIIVLMLWASGVSYAMHSVALSDGRIEAYVKKACAEGDPSGIINVEIVSDYGPFDIVIKDDQGNISHSANVEVTAGKDFIGDEDKTELLPGTYTVQVTDSQCAVAEMEVEVGVKDPINISANPAAICAVGEGSISPVITGGEGNYTFLWNNGATTQNITGLSVGNFTVTVTDAGGCSKSEQFDLKNGYPISFPSNFIVIDVTCNQDNGQIITNNWHDTYIIGANPLQYSWSNGSSDSNLSNLSPGLYTVTVTGANGCTGVKEQSVGNFGVNIIHEDIAHVCAFGGLGYIWIEVDRPSTFEWSENSGNIETGYPYLTRINNIPEGTYCITITDNETGCTLNKCYDIITVAPVEIIGTHTTGTCAYSNKGSATVNHINGTFPYTYRWLHQESGTIYDGVSLTHQHTINNLYKGHYSVTVTDDCGKTSEAECIVESDEFNVEVEIINGCKATMAIGNLPVTASVGQAIINVNGINPPFEVSVIQNNKLINKKIITTSTGEVQFDKLENSFIYVVVKDSKGCEFYKKYNINTTLVYSNWNDIKKACGNTDNGSIAFKILNPSGKTTKALHHNLLVFSTTKLEDSFTLDGLTGNEILDLIWESDDDCFDNTFVPFEIGIIETEKILVSYTPPIN